MAVHHARTGEPGRVRHIWPTNAGPAQALAIEVVELAPVALLLVSGAGRVWLANRRAEVLAGRPAERMLGLPVGDLVEAVCQTPPGPWPCTGTRGAGLPTDGRVHRPDGTTVDVEVRTGSLTVPNGRWAIVALHESGRPALLVRPLLDVAMAVQAAILMAEGPASSCLQHAASELDSAVRALQDLAFPPLDAGEATSR